MFSLPRSSSGSPCANGGYSKFPAILDLAHGREAVQVYRAVDEIRIVFSKTEVLKEELLQIRRTLVANLETHGRAVAAGGQLTLQSMREVADLFVVNVEI